MILNKSSDDSKRAESGDRCSTKNPEKEVKVLRSHNADVRRKVTSNSILRQRSWIKEKRSSEEKMGGQLEGRLGRNGSHNGRGNQTGFL